MPIYKEKKIINIGIPKTCCTSIYHTFKDKNNKWLLDTKNICIEGNNKPISHMTLKELTDYYKNINISEYTIFTIIRNPYDKIFCIGVECKISISLMCCFNFSFICLCNVLLSILSIISLACIILLSLLQRISLRSLFKLFELVLSCTNICP